MERYAILHDFKIENLSCVTFIEIDGDTEAINFKCFPDDFHTRLEIDIFENHELLQKLADN